MFATRYVRITRESILAPAPILGKSAVSLAPCVRRDVHGAELQVGRTVWVWGGLCQLY